MHITAKKKTVRPVKFDEYFMAFKRTIQHPEWRPDTFDKPDGNPKNLPSFLTGQREVLYE